MNITERIEALTHFEYSEREARFLCLAALHGGYFLRRQFAAFSGKSVGGSAAALIEKALNRGHVQATTYAAHQHIYHLCARPFYAAIGQEDNRNRRTRQPATIQQKLMAFDYVLAHPEYDYLATEQEKLDYFTGVLQLDSALLPTKRYCSRGKTTERYFVEKYPLFLMPPSQAAVPAAPCFGFVDDGLASISAFATFLHQYAPLWSHLREFQVTYIAARPSLFGAASDFFERFTSRVLCARTPRDEAVTARLLAHFEARSLYESRQWAAFDRAKLIRLRDERHEFSGEKYETLYLHWKRGGTTAVRTFLTPAEGPAQPPVAMFQTCHLDQNYDLFGR